MCSENMRSKSGYTKMYAYIQLHIEKNFIEEGFFSPLLICNVSRSLANVSSPDVGWYCRPLFHKLSDDAGSSVKQNDILRDVEY